MKAVFVGLILLFVGNVYGQVALSGKVKNELGEPIAQATIHNSKNELLAVTDNAGFFTFNALRLPVLINSNKFS